MSRKYFDKVLQGSGYSSVPVRCAYAENLLKKMGWTE